MPTASLLRTPLATNQQNTIAPTESLANRGVQQQGNVLLGNLIPENNEQLVQIMKSLRRLQRNVGMRTRFHLIVESDEEPTPNTSPSAASYNVDCRTKIIHSPTLSFRRNSDLRCRRLVHHLVSAMNELSFISLHPTQQNREQNDLDSTEVMRRTPLRRLFSSDDEESIDEEFLSIEPFTIPYWFPFSETGQHPGLPERSSEPLVISEEIAKKFDSLPSEDISNLYRTFFEMLHSCAKKRDRNYRQGKLKYSMFTPPWLRSRLIVSGNVCEMPKLAIQDQREQRNRQGYKRMAWIMAAFYEKESAFGRFVLEYLLDNLPSLREQWKEKNESRRQPATPLQRLLAGKKKTVIRNKISPRTRHLSERGGEPEAAPGPSTPNPTPPRQTVRPAAGSLNANETSSEVPDLRSTGESSGSEKDDEILAGAHAVPSQRQSVESSNGPQESFAIATHELASSQHQHRNVRKSVFDGLPASKSVPPPVPIVSSSGSSARKPPIKRSRKNRRLREVPIEIKTSDDDGDMQNNVQQVEKLSKAGTSGLSTTNSRRSKKRKHGFISVHGGRLELDLDIGIQGQASVSESQTQQNNNPQVSSNEIMSNTNADDIHEIHCAAGTKCIFKDSAASQDPGSITGRCRGCSKKNIFMTFAEVEKKAT